MPQWIPVRATLAALAALAAFTPASPALAALVSPQAGAFRFQPERVEAGVVYHYLKTNVDGTKPERVSLYVASADRIEAFKFHPKAERAGLVVAEMDRTTFSARRIESYQVFAGGEKQLFATLDYAPAERALTLAIPPMGIAGEKTEIRTAPWHLYNFDLASLNVSFRHLADPRKPFTIGVADPVFGEKLGIVYKGEATVTYAGDESRGGVSTRRYRIEGPPFGDDGVTVWVDAARHHVVDIESPVPDNPEWQSFKLKLTEVGKMTPAEWEAFQSAQF